MSSTRLTTLSFAALVVLAPAWALAQTGMTGAGEPVLLAQAAPPPLPQPPGSQYFYNDNGKPVGPVTLDEIRAKIAAGTITPDTLVWKAGTPGWVAAKELTEVAALFQAPAPAPSPAPAPAPAPAAAAGCTGKVLLSDDFRQVDDSWAVDPDSDAVTVEDGKVKVKAEANGHYALLYNGQPFEDADYCVTIQSPRNLKDLNDTNVMAGLVFWAQDRANLYALQTAPDGSISLGREVKGRWMNPVPWRQFSAYKKGPGAKNMLHVTTSSNSIVAYVNGERFASVRGQLPDGGGVAGLWVQSEKSGRNNWKFLNLKVTEHPK